MEKLGKVLLLCLLIVPAYADEKPSAALSPNRLQITACAEGAAVINATDPDFAFGAGLRYYVPLNPLATIVFHGEFMRRNTFFKMNSIDLSGLVIFGREFYYGLGLYLGLVLNMEQVYGWKTKSSADFGWVADIGYHFSNPNITAGFSVHMGLTDLQPKQTNRGGFINQTNIRWGLWLGYQIL